MKLQHHGCRGRGFERVSEACRHESAVLAHMDQPFLSEGVDQSLAGVLLDIQQACGLRKSEGESGRVTHLGSEELQQRFPRRDIAALGMFGGFGLHATVT